ncbi:MAG TPA: hypothetical protein VK116_19545, partial [Planctomycetota bacterium]|nr:hypothetical protein [Planctomycetota bacterium]
MRLFTRVVAALGAYLALLGISFWVFGSLRESVTWSLDGTSLHIAWWGAAMLAQIGAVFLVCALIARFHREHGTRALKIGGNAVLLSVFF